MKDDEDAPARGGHTPVLLKEVIEVLRPRDGGIYVDGTFGAGGYATAILESARCRVWAIDRDPAAVARGAALAERFSGRLVVVEGRFGQMDRLLGHEGLSLVNGIALDLGVSSPQIDAPERGFSFRLDGPLDMRMAGTGSDGGASAAEVVNSLPEAELAELIFRYGEERRARRVARAIVAARREKPIERTLELAEIVRKVVRRAADGRDPATRTFQALRIHVNDELGELQRGLEAAERLLSPDGRLAVVAFHSLEDRIAKDFLAARSGHGPGVSRHLPAMEHPAPSFERLFKRAKRPDAAECAVNPRARSARLRAARRTAAPAWDSQAERGAA
jgi:16S rRNA (cytosine1402-N4)-methyltransferase